MSAIIIDPPVGPWSTRGAIDAWLQELDRIREEYAEDTEALAAIGRSVEEARRWLELAEVR